ncbi:MAG TPA: PAS domain S-box protein [Candidatus Marinimicrobia bacterium]|nr:PAS domain S-box protein [Candidatus Neomarinimicrobiota bacterium]HRS52282.1 PAS domain S-box protein [Candidatus Neomarinimicrobiota bacterium]
MERLRILLVESNAETVKIISTIVNNLGYQLIETVTNGTAAVKKTVELKPDLVLINSSLKGKLNGVDTLAQIRQNLDIPIVFIISQSERLDLEKLKKADANGYLFEPFTPEQVHCIIELALSNHKSEQNLTERQALLSTTLKSIGDAVITTDQKGLITFLNPVAEKLTGWSSQEATGKPLLEVFNIINESTGKKPPNPIKKILEKGLVIELANHTILISRDGQKIPIDDSGAPIKDEYGNILGAVLVFRDITEQRKAKKELEFEKTLIDAMLNTFPDYIFFKDLNSHFYCVSKSLATEVFGLKDPKDAIGKSDFDFFPSEFAQKDYNDEQELIKTGKSIIDKVERKNWTNGTVSWSSITKIPLTDKDGNIIGTFGVSKNITESKKLEEALRKSEEKYRRQFEESIDAIFLADAETGILIDCNKAAARLVGREKSEIIGQHQSILHPPSEIINGQSRTFLEHKKAKQGQTLESQVITKSGEVRDVEIKASVFEIEDQKVVYALFHDVTEQKRIEAELAKERNLLRVLLDTTPDHIYYKDRDSRFILMSKSQAERFGLSDPKEAIGKTDFDFFTEEHARPAFEDEQRIIRTGKPIIGIEEKETWPGGGISWVSTTKMPLLDENGEIIGTFGISRDITDRKLAEEQLMKAMEEIKNSEDKLKNIINGSAIPQFFIDKDHKVVYWNTALTALTGIKSEEIVGTTNHWKAFYDNQRPCLADLLVNGSIKNLPKWYSDKYQKSNFVENGFEATDFFPNLGKDGKWIFFTAVAIKDSKGEIIGVLETLEDITERKRAEEALAREKTLFKTVIDNIPDKIYAKDTEGRFIVCNKAVVERMGKSDEKEIISKTDFDFIDNKLANQFRTNELEIIKTGIPLINHEEPLDQAEGGMRWNSTTKVPLRDLQGNIIGIVGVGRDITERKQAEEQREKFIAELQEALDKIKTLKGLIPICACCKKIRDDQGYWNNVESYIKEHAEVEFTHGICPDCMKKLYPNYCKDNNDKKEA